MSSAESLHEQVRQHLGPVPLRLRLRTRPHWAFALLVGAVVFGICLALPGSAPFGGLIGSYVGLTLRQPEAWLHVTDRAWLEVERRRLTVTTLGLRRRWYCLPGVALRVEGLAFRLSSHDARLLGERLSELPALADDPEPSRHPVAWYRDRTARGERVAGLRAAGGRSATLRAAVPLARPLLLAAFAVVAIVAIVVAVAYGHAVWIVVGLGVVLVVTPEHGGSASSSWVMPPALWADDRGVWVGKPEQPNQRVLRIELARRPLWPHRLTVERRVETEERLVWVFGHRATLEWLASAADDAGVLSASS